MLLAIVIFIFIIFFILNNLTEKNYQIVNIEGDLKDTKERNGLMQLLNDISSADKIILNGIIEEWGMTKGVIDEELNNQIISIIREVLNSISGISKYLFFVKKVENMYVMKDSEGNFRCILNCFIYEIKKYYTIKLSMDIVSYEDEIYFNFIDIDESSINTILNRYDIKWDSMGILSKYDTFDKNTKDILDNYYNSNYDIVYLNNKDPDIDKTSTFTLNQLIKYYRPSNIPIDESSPYLCKKNLNQWNYKGIKERNIQKCTVNDNSYQGFPNLPINGPSTITHNPDNNEHRWLFSPKNDDLFA